MIAYGATVSLTFVQATNSIKDHGMEVHKAGNYSPGGLNQHNSNVSSCYSLLFSPILFYLSVNAFPFACETPRFKKFFGCRASGNHIIQWLSNITAICE